MNLRIWRSPASAFGVFRDFENENEFQYESCTANAAYTDDELQKIADNDFNAIWVHARLDHLAATAGFPEFGKNRSVHLEQLNALIGRAATFGLKVILYLQPPRAVYCDDLAFWEKHGDVGGEVTEILDGRGAKFNMRSLCTSLPEVRQYLREAFSGLVKSLPGLGGLLIISASEYPAHCYSRRNCRPGEARPFDQTAEQVPVSCSACSQLPPEDVIVNLLHDIRDGVRTVSNNLPIMFWNWGWSIYLVPAEESIVSRMPSDCILVCDFERGGIRKTPGGLIQHINEYSLAYPGPSETFCRAMALAAGRGIKIIPKLQIGTTHELATVVNLPLLHSLYRKAEFMRDHEITGFLGCWNFGTFLSANTAGFNFFLNTGQNEYMFAKQYFPGCNTAEVVKAWAYFSRAMDYYPFSVHFLYYSPLNYTLAYLPEPGPLSLDPAGRSWLPDKRGDDLSESLHDFPLPLVMANLRDLAENWQRGVEYLEKGLKHCSPAGLELNNAVLCGLIFASAVNIYQIFELKKTWDDNSMSRYCEILSFERDIVQQALPLLEEDKRQGFHIEAHQYLYNTELLERKLARIHAVCFRTPWAYYHK